MSNVISTNLRPIDCDRLKHDYPWVNFIGLVGYDTRRQRFVLVKFVLVKFVLVKMGNEEANKSDQTGLPDRE